MNINRLNDLVNESKLNKNQIAEYSSITRTTLNNLLAGKDSKISTLESVSKALGVAVGYLFDEEEKSIGHRVLGNENKVQGNINISKDKKALETETEIEHLKALLQEKEERLKDKDRMIEILTTKTKEQ